MHRVLRELLGSAVAGCQGEPKQRKHLLSKALKRAHNVLGNHQLVSQASLIISLQECDSFNQILAWRLEMERRGGCMRS